MSERTIPDGRGSVRGPADPAAGGGPVAVVGTGSIGVAWAIVFARAGSAVALYDPDPSRLELAAGELERRLTALGEAGLLAEEPGVVASRVTRSGDLAATVAAAAHVQECAPEDLELKRQLFAELDRLAGPGVALASSSSALPVSGVADGLPGAARCLVAHPANPPYLLPIVELVPAPFTDPAVVEATRQRLAAAGMSPVVLRREVEGFVYNRLQGALLREAYCLVRDGVVSPADVDSVMRNGLGRRWAVLGPFETVELNTRGGIDVHAKRMGPAYWRMGRERGQDDPWGEALVAEVSASVQRRFPRQRWEEAVEWRDRALMAYEALRRANPWLAAPPWPGPPAGERAGRPSGAETPTPEGTT